MISYELAKQLKDAGFPLRMTDHEYCVYQQVEILDGISYHLPSLSELIEACGESFYALEHQPQNKLGKWYVVSTISNTNPPGPVFYSATAEEAVAHLWLALHKKS